MSQDLINDKLTLGQAITWTNVDQVPWHHVAPPGVNDLIIVEDFQRSECLWIPRLNSLAQQFIDLITRHAKHSFIAVVIGVLLIQAQSIHYKSAKKRAWWFTSAKKHASVGVMFAAFCDLNKQLTLDTAWFYITQYCTEHGNGTADLW